MPQEQWIPKKPNFGPPPPGYVAGIGRGATGFITRSDMGPVGIPDNTQAKQVQIDDAAYADSKYDSWEGYKGALFSKAGIDEEDKQADEAYDFCEKRVYERREKQKDEKIEEELKKFKKEEVPISQRFTDIKRELSKITTEEWENIPEAVDSSIKKRKKDKYTPVPDTMIASLLNTNASKNPVQMQETNQDFREAKEILLKSTLQKAEGGVSGRSSVDRIGYLTQLSTSKITSEFVGDVKRARALLKCATESNPKNPDIWVSAARVEELDGKLDQAKSILWESTKFCPLSQDIWYELSRLEKTNQQSQATLIEGLRHIPHSEKLWIYASRKQPNKEERSKIIRKGLENIPSSVRLWRQLIELEDMEEAKKLLYKAVECLPKEVDLWLALAKLQNYENAKQVLNKARKANPFEVAIWINAAKLEETQSKNTQAVKDKIEKILTKAREILKKNGNEVSRDEWLQQALLCERSQNLLTCEMLVKISIGLGLTAQELHNAVLKDANLFENERQSIYTTRYIYKHGVQQLPSKIILQNMIQFEKRMKMEGKNSSLDEALQLGLKMFAEDAQFWLLNIRKLIMEQNLESALKLIDQSQEHLTNQDRVEILLQKVLIFKKQKKVTQARMELAIMIKMHPCQHVFIEAARLEFENENFQQAWSFCEEGFKNSRGQRLLLLAFTIKKKISNYHEAKLLLERALDSFPQSFPLWKLLIEFQLEQGSVGKARAVVDKALIKLSKCTQLYALGIELELKHGATKEANFLLAKALKAFPRSPEVWELAIDMEPSATKKKKAITAIQECGQSPLLSGCVARLFWKDNKVDKAKKWFEEGLKQDKQYGDLWAFYIKFIREKFQEEAQIVSQKLNEVEGDLHGKRWERVVGEFGQELSRQETMQKLISIIRP